MERAGIRKGLPREMNRTKRMKKKKRLKMTKKMSIRDLTMKMTKMKKTKTTMKMTIRDLTMKLTKKKKTKMTEKKKRMKRTNLMTIKEETTAKRTIAFAPCTRHGIFPQHSFLVDQAMSAHLKIEWKGGCMCTQLSYALVHSLHRSTKSRLHPSVDAG